jgi:hypothetical protein
VGNGGRRVYVTGVDDPGEKNDSFRKEWIRQSLRTQSPTRGIAHSNGNSSS